MSDNESTVRDVPPVNTVSSQLSPTDTENDPPTRTVEVHLDVPILINAMLHNTFPYNYIDYCELTQYGNASHQGR